MSRADYVIHSMGFLAGGALLALLIAPPPYHCALAERWLPYDVVDWLRDIDWCYRYGSSSLEVFFAVYLIPLVVLLAALPAVRWLKKLGRSPFWAVVALIPMTTPLLMGLGQGPMWLVYQLIPLGSTLFIAGLSANPSHSGVSASSATRIGLAALASFMGLVLYQSLVIYPFWLAAKT